MRAEVATILRTKGYAYFDLPLVARLLLVTDGTVTELLEAMVGEPLTVGYKKQSTNNIGNVAIDIFPSLRDKNKKTACLQRTITLRGTKTAVDWLYAESVILHESLDAVMQAMLLEEKIPLGSILNDYNADNHRRIVDCGIATNAVAAKRLKLHHKYAFTYRVYHIIKNAEPIIHITEWFPIERINDKISAKT